jgi:hypothetical protein
MFEDMIDRFQKLYKARAYLKHYTDFGAETQDLEEAQDILQFLIGEYEGVKTVPELPPRPHVIV